MCVTGLGRKELFGFAFAFSGTKEGGLSAVSDDDSTLMTNMRVKTDLMSLTLHSHPSVRSY